MPRMLATILPSGVLGLVVAGMLAATMSVNSSYLLGWSSIIAQDIIGPLRKKPLTSLQQVMLNRGANLFVSLFVMVWGLWYTMPGPTYFYLNMTATIYLSGTLVAVIAGLFWNRASTLGGYLAMAGGAVATIGFFFFKTPASYAGAGAFALAAIGMIVGSLLIRSGKTLAADFLGLIHDYHDFEYTAATVTLFLAAGVVRAGHARLFLLPIRVSPRWKCSPMVSALSNSVLSMSWKIAGGQHGRTGVQDQLAHADGSPRNHAAVRSDPRGRKRASRVGDEDGRGAEGRRSRGAARTHRGWQSEVPGRPWSLNSRMSAAGCMSLGR